MCDILGIFTPHDSLMYSPIAPNQSTNYAMKQKCHYLHDIFATACTTSCQFNNFWCILWQKYHWKDNISNSVQNINSPNYDIFIANSPEIIVLHSNVNMIDAINLLMSKH